MKTKHNHHANSTKTEPLIYEPVVVGDSVLNILTRLFAEISASVHPHQSDGDLPVII